MTDRDHFAAAALTGLLYPEVDDEFAMSYIVGRAYLWADAMLRERCREGGDCPGQDNAANLDAVPAARAGDAGAGDTQSFDAYRRFVGEVMNWISEATSAYAASCRSDGGMKIMADACSRCWDAFDRIAHTDHGASPEARASVDSVAPQPTTRGDSDRTDKAAPRPSEGTGDTPVAESATTAEPVAWGVANGSRVLATSISRMDAVDMQGDYAYHTEIVPLYRHPPVTKPMPQEKQAEVSDRSKPITGPDPDSRVWETHTPATHTTPGEGSVPRDGTEPVAWAVCTPGDGDWSPCFFHEPRAQRCANAIVGEKNVVPLYRSPTLTDAEAETLRELRDEAAQYADEIGLCASEVRGRQRIIDGLLGRTGGGR